MKKIRNYKTLAFGLAVLLFMLQITSSAAIWQTEKAKAATGPQDTSTIVVSGAAVTVDPNIVMSSIPLRISGRLCRMQQVTMFISTIQFRKNTISIR